MRLNQSRRQLIGFVYSPQVDNNIQQQQLGRVNQTAVQKYAFESNMIGTGFMDIVNSILKKGKLATSTISDLATSQLGTDLRNLIPASDENARAGFAGEKHMILKLANGRNGVANFMGPATQVIKRVKRGDKGRTPSDTVAKRHDIDYMLANNSRTKAGQLKKVRQADNRMINSLKRIKKNRSDAGRNISAGMRLIQAKVIAENVGVLKKDKFSGPLEKLSLSDNALLSKTRDQLEQEGFGLLPAELMHKKLIKKLIKKSKNKSIKGGKINISKSGNGQSRKRGLGKTYKLAPKPIVGAGFKFTPKHKKILMKKAIPALVKSLNLPKSTVKTLNKIVPKILRISKADTTKTLKGFTQIIKNLSKGFIPILAHRSLNKKGGRVSGRGVVNMLKKKGTSTNKLIDNLSISLFKLLSAQMRGKGSSKVGTGFFSDFAKGFKSVFKPAASILGPIATALGQPEIGIPLTILSGVL